MTASVRMVTVFVFDTYSLSWVTKLWYARRCDAELIRNRYFWGSDITEKEVEMRPSELTAQDVADRLNRDRPIEQAE